MPTAQHEGLHRIFRDNPELYTRAFKMLNIDFPAPLEISVVDTDMTEIRPIVRHADTVMLSISTAHKKHIIITEAQQEIDLKKVSSWAHYLSYVHTKYECPVTLVVVCNDLATARWAREGPLAIGLEDHPSLIVIPIVIGPDNVKAITDPQEAAADVVLTMLSALTHARSPQVAAILKALDHALRTIDVSTAEVLAEQTEIGLGNTKAGRIWKELIAMSHYRFRSESARALMAECEAKGKVEGEAKGRAEDILKILQERGIPLNESFQVKVLGTTDMGLLEAWLIRALHVTTAEELFG
ncbi:hypothetical protein AB0I81_31125 [Nonomuraea sp. NPDC050404]|uniref:hypothetical protein n=1 Tax=Nonomuraea sp. NPDC050404 TaxID=3155783 RepID=UPI0033DDA65C